MISFEKLVKASVHFGHKTSRWNPRMKPFIWGSKNNIHLIDVSQTALQLEKAAKFLTSVAAEGKSILWVGTKKVAQPVVERVAQSVQCPFVNHRWIGGTLTNYTNIRKLITKYLHYEDILLKADQFLYTKKELALLQKQVDRLRKNVANIRNLTLPVGAVILVDVRKDQTALREAVSQGIPVVALVDTNNDPSMVDYAIPANDDALSSIDILLEYLGQAVAQGKQEASTKAQAAAAAKAEDVVHEEPVLPTALLSEDEEEAERASRKKAKEAGRPKRRASESEPKKKDA